jgi:NADH-quinone oxidoreductase subunit M
LGAPVLPGSWSALVGLVGSLGRNPILTVAAGAGLVIAATAAVRIARTAFGAQPVAWRSSKYLEPFGGAPPDVRGRELLWALPLLVGVVAIGFLPRAFLGEGEQAIRDLIPKLDPPGPTQVS